MISINVIGDMISGSYGNTPFSRTYEKDIYEQMLELANKADDAATVEEYNGILSEFALLTTEDLTTRRHIADVSGDMFLSKDPAGRYFIEYEEGDVIIPRYLSPWSTGYLTHLTLV